MVVFRHGDLHAPYAVSFIEARIPTWTDKPFTIKIEDARKLIEAADKHTTLLTGGSTCKYAYDVLMLKNTVENGKGIGNIISGNVNFPADPGSEYGGLFFYGPHLSEMVMAIFGYDVQSVLTSVCNGVVTAIAKYDRFLMERFLSILRAEALLTNMPWQPSWRREDSRRYWMYLK